MSIEKKYIEDVLHPFIRPHNNQFSSKGRGRAGIIMMMDNDGKGILARIPRPDHYDNDVHNVYAVRHGLRVPRPYHCPHPRPIKRHPFRVPDLPRKKGLFLAFLFQIAERIIGVNTRFGSDDRTDCPCNNLNTGK